MLSVSYYIQLVERFDESHETDSEMFWDKSE